MLAGSSSANNTFGGHPGASLLEELNKADQATANKNALTVCNKKDNHKQETTHIWYASHYNCLSCVREFLKKDPALLNKEGGYGMFNVYSGTSTQRTPLMVAARYGSIDVATYLLQLKDCDFNHRNSAQEFALMLAKRYSHSACVAAIEQRIAAAERRPSAPVALINAPTNTSAASNNAPANLNSPDLSSSTKTSSALTQPATVPISTVTANNREAEEAERKKQLEKEMNEDAEHVRRLVEQRKKRQQEKLQQQASTSSLPLSHSSEQLSSSSSSSSLSSTTTAAPSIAPALPPLHPTTTMSSKSSEDAEIKKEKEAKRLIVKAIDSGDTEAISHLLKQYPSLVKVVIAGYEDKWEAAMDILGGIPVQESSVSRRVAMMMMINSLLAAIGSVEARREFRNKHLTDVYCIINNVFDGDDADGSHPDLRRLMTEFIDFARLDEAETQEERSIIEEEIRLEKSEGK